MISLTTSTPAFANSPQQHGLQLIASCKADVSPSDIVFIQGFNLYTRSGSRSGPGFIKLFYSNEVNPSRKDQNTPYSPPMSPIQINALPNNYGDNNGDHQTSQIPKSCTSNCVRILVEKTEDTVYGFIFNFDQKNQNTQGLFGESFDWECNF